MKLTDTLGNTHNIRFPRGIKSVSLAKGLGWNVACENIDRWLHRQVKNNTIVQESNYYLYMLAEAVGKFCDIDLNDIMNWNIEDLLDEDGNLFPEVAQSHIKGDAVTKDYKAIDNLLTYLAGRINNLMAQYKFKPKKGDHVFKYKGLTYRIPTLIKSLVLGKQVFDKVTVGQSIDIMKTKKYLASVQDYQENLDNKRNVTYTSFLQIVAILALKQNEEYPAEPEKAIAHVQERAAHFKDIKYTTAHDIVFFLITSGKPLKKTEITNTISILLAMKSLRQPSNVIGMLGIEQVTTP